MRKILTGLALCAASAFFAGGAGALGSATAKYSADGSYAQILATAREGGRVRLYGEQADGSYLLVGSATVGVSGTVTLWAPVRGPSDGRAQFLVWIGDSSGAEVVYIADKEYAFD